MMKWTKWGASYGIGVFCLMATSISASASGKRTEPKVIEIHGKKFAYSPSEITVVKGETYRLHLTSDDVPHSLRIKALDASWEMKSGEFDDVLFTPEQTGDFKADCGRYCGKDHKMMSMTVHVVDK